MELGLAGRGCVITGAGRGIGRATSRLLCAEGAHLLLVARSAGELDEAVTECGEAAQEAGSGGTAAALALDVTDPEAAERIAAAASERPGTTEILVNNAGAARWRDLDEIPERDWYAAWELNVMAPKRLMERLLPPMRERGWGRAVNVASTAGKRPSANMGEYSVAKAAQLSLSRLFADRYAGSGVLVNAICPGPVASEMWTAPGGLAEQSARLAGHDDAERALEAAGSGRPIGRLAEVEEIAGAIAFLCSERASYVAGAAWSVDGGTVQVII